MRSIVLPVTVILLMIAWRIDVAPAGDIYKSVDAQGHVVYSDDPAATGDAQDSVDVGSTESDDEGDVRADQPPPILVDEEQPPSPGDDYVWVPGYWAWSDDGYYWVPGSWQRAPEDGWLWTPGYWAYSSDYYVFHRGYWGRHRGYYGGINYGHGYPGSGSRGRRVSYNGGRGGTTAVMTASDRAAAAERHMPATVSQQHAIREASRTADRVPRARPTMRSTPIVRPPTEPVPQRSTAQTGQTEPLHGGPANAQAHSPPGTPERDHPAPAPSAERQRPTETPTHSPSMTPSARPATPSLTLPSH